MTRRSCRCESLAKYFEPGPNGTGPNGTNGTSWNTTGSRFITVNRMRWRVLILCLFLLSCEGLFLSERAFRDTYDGMIGEPIARWEELAGPADRILEAPNGNRIYIYHLYEKVAPKLDCTMFWEVDERGIIVGYRYKGPDCVSPGYYSVPAGPRRGQQLSYLAA